MAANTPRRQPTLDDVAERAGVSRSAASRVINKAPHARQPGHARRGREGRQGDGLPAEPHRSGPGHPADRHRRPRVSHDDPELFADPFFAQVIVGVSAALEQTDLHLLLCLANSGRGRARLTYLLHTCGVDGIMLMALRGDDPLSHIVWFRS